MKYPLYFTPIFRKKDQELEEKYARMKIWREAKDTIANEYLKLLCSYTKQEILNKN